MLVYIVKRKSCRPAFLGIKADRDALYGTDIIYGTFLLEIGKRNVMVFFIDLNGVIGVGTF